MAFDVRKYLDSVSIEYIEEGPNVPVGNNVAIHCPHCGDRDPSEHLIVSSDYGFYYCWICEKNGTLVTLIKHIEGCSYPEAKEIFKGSGIATKKSLEEPQDEVEEVLNLHKPDRITISGDGDVILPMPNDRLPIETGKECKMLREFLEKRRISMEMVREYNLWYCRTGRWADRLLIPIYDEEGYYVGFGGRGMVDSVSPKYLYPKGWSTRKELFGIERIVERDLQCEVLIVVEGMFDAMRLGNIAVASFTHRISNEQVLKLVKLYKDGKFKHLVVAYDGDSYDLSKSVAERLSMYLPSVNCLRLPPDKDPDDLGRKKILEMIKESGVG